MAIDKKQLTNRAIEIFITAVVAALIAFIQALAFQAGQIDLYPPEPEEVGFLGGALRGLWLTLKQAPLKLIS